MAARIAEPEHWREAKNAVIGAESKAFSPIPPSNVSPRWTSHGMAAWIITTSVSDCYDYILTIFLSCFLVPMENNHFHRLAPPWHELQRISHCLENNRRAKRFSHKHFQLSPSLFSPGTENKLDCSPLCAGLV